MAIFAKLDGSKAVNYVRVVCQGPPGATAAQYPQRLQEFTPTDTGMNAHATELDGRFKVAGSTSWERPGGPTTP
jgi:hypothetical protein